MEISIFSGAGSLFLLSTDHAASSYGAPVLIERCLDWSRVMGPNDSLTGGPMTSFRWTARDLVELWAAANGRTAEERAFGRAFLESAPTAAQEVTV